MRCTYDPTTRGGDTRDGRRVKGTIHWVSAAHALVAEARLYDHLFTKPVPGGSEESADWKADLNPRSLETLTSCRVEPGLANAAPGRHVQLERTGYFFVDAVDSSPTRLVLNRTVSLRDSWAKIEKAGQARR